MVISGGMMCCSVVGVFRFGFIFCRLLGGMFMFLGLWGSMLMLMFIII